MPTFEQETEVTIALDTDDIASQLSTDDWIELIKQAETGTIAAALDFDDLRAIHEYFDMDDEDEDESPPHRRQYSPSVLGPDTDLDDVAALLIQAGPKQLQALPDNTLAQLLSSLTPALCDLTKEIEAQGYLPSGLLQELKLLAGCSS